MAKDKNNKSTILSIINQLMNVNDLIYKAGEIPDNVDLITCQKSTIQCGTYIETNYADCDISSIIHCLEDYCEIIYQLSNRQGDVKTSEIRSLTEKGKKLLMTVENSIQHNLTDDKIQIVFLPYKASMWDSLESIWMEASKDPKVECFVIPVPFFDRNSDGSIGEMHYEGDEFPDYVPITDWQTYCIPDERPDIAFIHYPYDKVNYVTILHPDFFASNIRKYVEKLVYVPYFILPGTYNETFALTNGVIYSNLTFVQNEDIREKYIKSLKSVNDVFEKMRWEDKIIALGSPKTDRIIREIYSKQSIAEKWKKVIGNRKSILLNTNVSLILNNGEFFIDNLKRIFDIFEKHKDKYAVIWREHPLTMATIESMKPKLKNDYLELKQYFENSNLGIIDVESDPYDAIRVSDCYFGAGGSLLVVYGVTGKPMMVTDYYYPKGISEKPATLETVLKTRRVKMYAKERNENSLDLFLDNLEIFEDKKEDQLELVKKITMNINGSVGKKIYQRVMND